jgi:gliding motility-associated-like protein
MLCLLFSAVYGSARHIVGGEIYYDYLGTDRYYITLKIYLDCCPGCTPEDDVAAIGVFNAQGEVVQNHLFPILGKKNVPPTLYTKCFTIPSDICVNEILYGDTLELPPIPGGYTVSYQRCCRNADIINVANANQVGSTYQVTINPLQAGPSSSARYKNLPPLVLCVGAPFEFDHSALDPDNDSIYYEFCSPFEGADAMSPMPDTPSTPPYKFVDYNAPYTGSYPIASAPGFKIDPHTGFITGTPIMIGRFVVGVCAKEFRNGMLLNVNKRDYQFNVTNCPKAAQAYIPEQINFCSGLTLNFTQQSTNAMTYYWDFGDLTTLLDTSNLANPTWTYPDTGTYSVTLIINKFTKCADTTIVKFKVQALLSPYFFPPPPKCMNEYLEGFTPLGLYTSAATFKWSFPMASPSSSNLKDPGKILYNKGGTYPVILTVTQGECVKQFADTVRVFQRPLAKYETEVPILCGLGPVHFINKSNGVPPLTYKWSFGDDQISTDESPYHIYKKHGTYPTQLNVISGNGCKDTFNLPAAIEVIQLPTAGFDIDPKDTSIFYSEIHLFDHSKVTTSCNMYWGDGSATGNCTMGHTYAAPGTYQIMQIAENRGCYDTAYAKVIIRPEFRFWLPNAFTPASSEGLNDVFKPTLYGVHDYRFFIFDRWGEKIFETSDPQEGWSGYKNNQLCQQDVYIYKIIFKDDVNLKTHQYVGHFTLVR